jgi:hypothetical protein
MGNTPTKKSTTKGDDKSQLFKLVNKVATKYILTQNFNDMKNLENKAYCDKLVILTSDVIADKLDDLEITYLAQKLEKGTQVDKKKTENVIYLQKDDLNKLDVKDTKSSFKRKQRMCIGIARYYVKIAHVFAAIVKSIDPVYTYKNELGNKEVVDFFDKKKIPKNVSPHVKKNSICFQRIRTLMNEHVKHVESKDLSGNEQGEKSKNVIKTSFCNMNKGKDDKLKTLADEPGMSELKKLYYDVFNFETNKYYKMSDESKRQYEKDVATFYQSFTGKSKDDSIKNFEDIKLLDYSQLKHCKKDGNYRKPVDAGETYFKEYGTHLATMMKNVSQSQNKLVDILQSLFVETQDGSITIHPLLNYKKLDSYVNKTREILVAMYVMCEEDFKKGLQLFEVIVENQIKENTKRKIENLEKTLEK